MINKFKANKAITLIQLVITIVIMLILATVSINLILGNNGIFNKSKVASSQMKYSSAEEKVANAVAASYNVNGLDDIELKDNINKIDGLKDKIDTVSYDLEITVDGYKFKISSIGAVTGFGEDSSLPENTLDDPAGVGQEVALKDGWGTDTVKYVNTISGVEVTNVEKVATVYAISVGDANTIPIPKTFYYVGGNLDKGVVISDNEDDKYESGKDKVSHEYATKLKGNQFVWIPCLAENYKKIDWNKDNAKWDKGTNSAELTQIEKYGGFYIGRYEAGVSCLNQETGKFEDSVTFNNNASLFDAVSLEEGYNNWGWQNYNFIARQNNTVVEAGVNKANGKILEKANCIPYYHADYYTAEEMTKRLYSNNLYVNSGLVTGTQWDMMIKYLENGGVDVKNSTWGNYDNISLRNLRGYYTNISTVGATDGFKNTNELTTTNSSVNSYILLTTGSTADVMRKNLYDVAGNLWEWTQETSYVKNFNYATSDIENTYMLRGGSSIFTNTDTPACVRGCDCGGGTGTNFGFRAVLYIK